MSNLFRRNSVVRRGVTLRKYLEVPMFTLTLFELVSLIVGCTVVGAIIGIAVMCIMIGGRDVYDDLP